MSGALASRPTVRLATPADGPALCRLFREVPMDADLVLSTAREPDFFAYYRMQKLVGEEVHVAEGEGGALNGVATLLVREGYLDGEQVRVAYLGDLRLGGDTRGGIFFLSRFGPGLREAYERFGCQVGLTAILASNTAALRLLTKRNKRFVDQPVYRPWLDYTILNLLFTRRRRPRRTSLEVRPATAADLPAITARLTEDHQRRPFGYRFDDGLLEHRLAHWPGLTIDRFFLAFRSGRLVGVCAPWDAHAVKRFVIERYGGAMRWIRPAFNLSATLARFAKLPPPGQPMRYCTLTHVSVEGGEPLVMQALVDRVYADLHREGYHYLSIFVPQGDHLASAYDRYRTTPLEAKLFTVSPPGSPFNERDPGPGRPGFEMALV